MRDIVSARTCVTTDSGCWVPSETTSISSSVTTERNVNYCFASVANANTIIENPHYRCNVSIFSFISLITYITIKGGRRMSVVVYYDLCLWLLCITPGCRSQWGDWRCDCSSQVRRVGVCGAPYAAERASTPSYYRSVCRHRSRHLTSRRTIRAKTRAHARTAAAASALNGCRIIKRTRFPASTDAI